MARHLSLKRRFCSILLLCSLWTPVFAGQYLTYRDGFDEYEGGNFSAAFLTFQRLAEEGDAPSQNALANMYLLGEGVAQDYGKAAQWFLRAANQGVAPAQLSLADLYVRGLGVARSDVDAYIWYSLSGVLADDEEEDHARLAHALRDGVVRRLSKADLAAARRGVCDWWRKYREQPPGAELRDCAVD